MYFWACGKIMVDTKISKTTTKTNINQYATAKDYALFTIILIIIINHIVYLAFPSRPSWVVAVCMSLLNKDATFIKGKHNKLDRQTHIHKYKVKIHSILKQYL